MDGRLARAGLAIGLALVVGLATTPAQAAPRPGGDRGSGALRSRLVICQCPQAVRAHFHVERYSADEQAWVGVPEVPVTVEARTPGNPSPAGWFAEHLLEPGSWSSVHTDAGGAGTVRLVVHPNTLEYRLRLPDGSRSTAVQPSCER